MRTRLTLRIRCQRNRDGLLTRGLLVFLTHEKLTHFSIELWCNGNTTDFDSVILGSSPSSSANQYGPHLLLNGIAWGFFYASLV